MASAPPASTSAAAPASPNIAPSSSGAASTRSDQAASTASIADSGTEHVHVFSLPVQVVDPDTGYVPSISIAAGELPSQAHPAGTVFVAHAPTSRTNVVVSEWDLASGKELREAPVPIPPEDAAVWMVRAGDRLHFVAWQYNNDIQYACMATSDLSPVHSERLGHVSVFGPAAIASDGVLTILVSPMVLRSDEQWWLGKGGYYGVTFDQNGRRIAARVLEKPHREGNEDWEYSNPMKRNAAVVGGQPYVVLGTADDKTYRLQRLRRDLTVEREWAIHLPSNVVDRGQVRLASWQDRLAIDSGFNAAPPSRILLNLDLKELSRGFPCPADPTPQGDPGKAYREVWLGRVHAVLHRGDSGKVRIAWTESSWPGPSPPALCGPLP